MDWDRFVAAFTHELTQDGPARTYVFARGDGAEETLETVRWAGDREAVVRVAAGTAVRLRRHAPAELRFTAWRDDPRERFDAARLRRAVPQLRRIEPTVYHQRFGTRLAAYARELARENRRLRIRLTPREIIGDPVPVKPATIPCWCVGWASNAGLRRFALTADGWLLDPTGLNPATASKDRWPDLGWDALTATVLDHALDADLRARRHDPAYRKAVAAWSGATTSPTQG